MRCTCLYGVAGVPSPRALHSVATWYVRPCLLGTEDVQCDACGPENARPSKRSTAASVASVRHALLATT